MLEEVPDHRSRGDGASRQGVSCIECMAIPGPLAAAGLALGRGEELCQLEYEPGA